MYAVIEASGKQHRISIGEKLKIDIISDKKKGDLLVIDKVLMIGPENFKIGNPFINNAYVKATISNMGKDEKGIKGEKIRVFKKKRRKGYHKTIGHRQRFAEIKINSIES